MCYVLQEGVKLKGGTSNSGSRSERVPLFFGVSGHRDLVPADLPKLHEQLRSIFARFRAAYPNTPFKLITPLAEGADRLAADVALAVGIGLLVPLPMKRKEYERDFAAVESLSEFRRLLAEADSSWEIPAALHPTGNQRTRQYAEVGEFIARSSHVLVLLWDGGDNKKIGGTAWVKKRRDHWVRAASDPLHGVVPLVYGPTIQVVTPRASGRGRRPHPATIGELPPSAAEFARTLSKPQANQRGGDSRKRPLLYQLVYQAIDNFNESLPDTSTARKRTEAHSATRSRL